MLRDEVSHTLSSSPVLLDSLYPKDKACEAMELFDELVECEIDITSHVSLLIRFFLELATNTTLGNSIRVKGLALVSWLITIRKKVNLTNADTCKLVT